MIRQRPRLVAVLVLLLAALALAPTPAPPARIVAVGDVHGDLRGLRVILQLAGVVDAAGNWAGGKTTLVQTGDLIDRGPDSRRVLDYVMGLERQASQADGRVIALLGNHEAMNIMGDLRYVTEPEFAAYADAKSERRRQAAWRRYQNWLKDHGAVPPAALETEWMKSHPIGFVEHCEAFDSRGRYGRWLRQRPAAAKVGDTLFVHGGISAAVAVLPLERLNARVAQEFRAFDLAREELEGRDVILPFFDLGEVVQRATALANAVLPGPPPAAEREDDALARVGWPGLSALLKYRAWLIVNRDGPLWFRGFAEWSDADGAAQVGGILEKEGVARVVVGHSTQHGRIQVRWNGRVFLIDTGMLPGYEPDGRGSALEIDGAQITAIYEDGRVPLNRVSPSGTPPQLSPVRRRPAIRPSVPPS